MRHYPLKSAQLYNEVGKKLLDAGINRVWADGEFKGRYSDTCTLMCEAGKLDVFKDIMDNNTLSESTYAEYDGTGELVFDNGVWVSNLPDFDNSLLKYGKPITETPFLAGFRKLLEKNGINRVYSSVEFTGNPDSEMCLLLESCDKSVYKDIIKYIDPDEEYESAVSVTCMEQDKNAYVVYEGGQFYSYAY